jgi:hypothetical protein
MLNKILTFNIFFIFLLFFLNLAISYTNLNSANAEQCNYTYHTFSTFINNNPGTTWNVHFRLKHADDPGGDGAWQTTFINSVWVSDTVAGGYDWGVISPYDNTSRQQWWTSCVDPITTGSTIGGTCYFLFTDEITCKQGTGNAIYAKCDQGSPNNLGSVAWNATCPIVPACTSNCSGVGTHQCSGNTSQTCQTVSGSPGCTRWANTTACADSEHAQEILVFGQQEIVLIVVQVEQIVLLREIVTIQPLKEE